MNKRSKSITTLFTAPLASEEKLSADNFSRKPRVSSGSIRSVRDSFSQVERENEALREALADREAVLEINPHLIDPSPIDDRHSEDDTSPAFRLLVESIAEHGQGVPVLLRPHRLLEGRYETAYGHRRIRAAKTLQRPVRAVVRPMSDEELVVAQGVENSARQDLSFIERAMFALRLERAGHSRHVVQRALSIDKAETSKMIAIASAVPEDIRRFIGPAPRIGRARWQALVDTFKRDVNAHGRVQAATIYKQDYKAPASSDDRFTVALDIARRSKAKATAVRRERSILSSSGEVIASFVHTGGEARFVIQGDPALRFADFLAERIPSLYETYAGRHGDPPPPTRKG